MLKLNNKVQLIKRFGNGVIAVCKGDGVLSHPNNNSRSKGDSIFDNATYDSQKELYRIDNTIDSSINIQDGDLGFNACYLLHRLDKGTSGVLLLSTQLESSQAIKSLFKTRQVKKQYFAIVHGRFMPSATMVWKDNMTIIKTSTTVRAHSSPYLSSNALHASTKVTGIAYDSGRNISTLLLEPQSGITHQLRFQCAQRDLPILGDDIYGKYNNGVLKSLPKKRLYLHAHRIHLQYSLQGQESQVDASAALPHEYSALIFHRR